MKTLVINLIIGLPILLLGIFGNSSLFAQNHQLEEEDIDRIAICMDTLDEYTSFFACEYHLDQWCWEPAYCPLCQRELCEVSLEVYQQLLQTAGIYIDLNEAWIDSVCNLNQELDFDNNYFK